MNIAADLQEIMADLGTACRLKGPTDAEPFPLDMIVRPIGNGRIDSRNGLAGFVDVASLPRGADFGYGLLLAADAPEGMHEEIKLTITDSMGRQWTSEAASPLCDTNPETRVAFVVGWRLILRGKQRMTRGK